MPKLNLAELRRIPKQAEARLRAARDAQPSSRWLVENFTYLRSTAREVNEAISLNFFRRLPANAEGVRIRGLVEGFLRASEPAVTTAQLIAFFGPHEELTIAELWAIQPFLKLGLLQRISETADTPELRRWITTLRSLEKVRWPVFVETVSEIEKLLREDPAGAYPKMDFATRDDYRKTVERLARRSRKPEPEVAQAALKCASFSPDPAGRHVGHWLLGRGRHAFERELKYSPAFGEVCRGQLKRFPNVFYLGSAIFLTVLLIEICRRAAPDAPLWFLVLLVFPAGHAALAGVNQLVMRLLPPKLLPKMDFRKGVPEDCRTFVVIPTLLLNRKNVAGLLENLEIHYLANRDANLSFGLLTDFADAPSEVTDKDDLAGFCAQEIRILNRRYRGQRDGREPFYLFHRPRRWNPSEGVWMGYERKRGKLNDLNHLLLTGQSAFEVCEGRMEALTGIRYVITLDSDTQLPRDTAHTLIAAMAHPLNRPVLDEKTRIVRHGYALMQPRVSSSLQSAGKSRLARLESGQPGIDPYTTAVSDVYQDLFERATFTGKGIYELAAFEEATRGRFAENTLLSHDLIEGEHVRAGFLADAEMIDDAPARYEAFCKRKHRWIRGDWQILFWLLPMVPDENWQWRPNPLPFVSRWKIFDNLRRSLFDAALMPVLLAAMMLGSGPLLTAVALLAFPAYLQFLLNLARFPPLRFWRGYLRDILYQFGRAHLDLALLIALSAHQSLLMADAIVRTLHRRFVSHRNLLEWESMAQAEASSGERLSLPTAYLLISSLLGMAATILLAGLSHPAGLASVPVCAGWILVPLIAAWLDARPSPANELTRQEQDFLRDAALKTWRFFADLPEAGSNWLMPDNVQEDPWMVAHRTSPTNIGLQLNAELAAGELGYLTAVEMAGRLTRAMQTVERLERHEGHLLNWYDTRTLEPLAPKYVSSVDSGNLAASLITLKGGVTARLRQPVVRPQELRGLADHARALRGAIPHLLRTGPNLRAIENLIRQLDYAPDDLLFWESVLEDVEASARELRNSLQLSVARSEYSAEERGEVLYWATALVDRAAAIRGWLCRMAPWLREPLETAVRHWLRNPGFREIIAHLTRVPTIEAAGDWYSAVELAATQRLRDPETLQPAQLDLLQQLLAGLPGAREAVGGLRGALELAADQAHELTERMNFRFLVDDETKLLRIGCDPVSCRNDESAYDLLASEARTAVFVAIAKGDLPRASWFRLGRKLTAWRGSRTLMSWSGTMFEYLMPSLFMRTHPETLLGQSLAEVVRAQRRYGREKRVPWGVSEAAHAERDDRHNYQYRAFGLPALSAKREEDKLVISPYSTMLALSVDPLNAIENLKVMGSHGWIGRYGFYESVDFHHAYFLGPRKGTVVRAFMVHHQGMSLLALTNALCQEAVREWFHADPMVMAVELLLHERVPVLVSEEPEDDEPARRNVAGLAGVADPASTA